MLKTFFICLILVGVCHSERNYVIKMTRFAVNAESDPSFADKGTLRVTQKAKNEYVVSGTWYLYKNLGNQVVATLTVYNIGLSGNLMLVYTKKGKLCDYLLNEKMMYPSLVAKSNFPSPDTCPFPKGNYTVRDYEIDEDQLPEVLPTGKFTGSSVLKVEQKTVLGFDFDFSVTPA